MSGPVAGCFAVAFVSRRRDGAETDGYADTMERMVALSAEQPGFLGMDSVRAPDGRGITVCYWESEAAIAAWRAHAEHAEAQRLGTDRWYDEFEIVVSRVERVSGWSR